MKRTMCTKKQQDDACWQKVEFVQRSCGGQTKARDAD